MTFFGVEPISLNEFDTQVNALRNGSGCFFAFKGFLGLATYSSEFVAGAKSQAIQKTEQEACKLQPKNRKLKK
jgi:hypothetical protein